MNYLLGKYILGLSAGIMAVSIVFLFIFGYKVRATRFHSLFWLSILLYLVSEAVHGMGVRYNYFQPLYTNLLIPVFYYLFIVSEKRDRFRFYDFFIFVVPVIYIVLFYNYLDNGLSIPVYHIIFWTILIAYSFVKKDCNSDSPRTDIYAVIVIIICIVPFIFFSLYYHFKSRNFSFSQFILPVSFSIGLAAEIFFIYRNKLIKLNKDYSDNIEIIKNQTVIEKKTIIQKLSASLIHEIKNPLTGIRSLTQQMTSRYDTMPDEKKIMYLDVISKEVDRIMELTGEFLKINSVSDDSKVITSLSDELDSVIKFIELTAGKGKIRIIKEIKYGGLIKINPDRFRQIILNLVYNSIESGASEIKIIADNYESGKIVMTISDNGCGIKPDIKEKIFDAFFTTKQTGSGIGLALCREIISQYGGSVTLKKWEAGNTEFELIFNCVVSGEVVE